MLTATAETLVDILGGTLVAGAADVVGNDVTVDSRTAAPGCIFIALPGEHADGHDFLHAALSEGARILIVTRPAEEITAVLEAAEASSAAVIHVSDGLGALQDMASWHRDRLFATVIGVTGSNGKTTTKDLLKAALSGSMRVVATEGNMNNEIGLPFTLLRAGADTDVVVAEMGMRGLGQIAHLARIARPTIGLVTNVGASHIEVLGSVDAVASAKGELVDAIPSDGLVLLNGDDAYTDRLSTCSSARVVTYGLGEACDVRATDIVLDDESRASFRLITRDGETRVVLSVPGRHNVYNALAAAACALELGVGFDEVGARLSEAIVSHMRMQVLTTPDGVTIINDAYNANPTSMRAAIDTLSNMRVQGRRIAVLGDMAELGSLSELAHFEMGERVAESGVDLLLAVGPRARRIADGARAEGMEASSVIELASAEDALSVLVGTVTSSDVVLVKASRVMGLETIVEGIVSAGVS